MKTFHFSKIYFNKLEYNDRNSNIRVIIKEIPSLEVFEEDYSLRVETQHEEGRLIHRKYAIEHHSKFDKHDYPHLQFKFHTEEIGQFRIRIDFENQGEYRRGIQGFIYKIKDVLGYLEQFKEGITKEILIIDMVNKLREDGSFLSEKIQEGIKKYSIGFDEERGVRDKLKKLEQNQLLLGFMGLKNVKLIEDSYYELKKKGKR